MTTPAQIDERLAAEEVSPLSPEERAIADKCMAALTPEERALVTEMDLFTLVRGYQTYDPRLEESITALKKIVAWRQEVKYTEYLRHRLEHDEEFFKHWPERVHGADKYGHVLISIPACNIDVDKLLEFDQEHLLRLQGQKMTTIAMHKARLMAQTGVQRYKHSIVVDLNGMGMSLLGGKTRGFLQKLFAVGGDYFPESVWKIYVVNAPFMFRAIWAVVKPWIHPITVAKVNITGSPKDCIKKMAEYGLDASQVPTWAGGSSEGKDLFDVLRDFIIEHEKVPVCATGVPWPKMPTEKAEPVVAAAAAAADTSSADPVVNDV